MVEIKVLRTNFDQTLHMMYCLQQMLLIGHDNHQLSWVKCYWSRAMQSKIVRGPRGVQMEEVWAAADAVLGLGERPTIERVRQQLGRGSPNTVGPMLDSWYGSLAGRFRGPAEMEDRRVETESALPAPVLRAARAMWGRAMQYADEQAAAHFTQARAELGGQAEALRLAKYELEREQQRLTDRGEAYTVAMEARDAQIAELQRQAQELQQQLLTCQQMRDSASSEVAQLRQASDSDRQRQQASEAEHQTERMRLEERAQSQERRLNAEVDRARQESKRLALQLESETRKAARSLANALERVGELDTHVTTLQVEKAALSPELQSAREQINGLQLKADERKDELLAVLNELRTRLPSSTNEEVAPVARVRVRKAKR
jgi:peptidoglycan hydrolase CwlO-like protein